MYIQLLKLIRDDKFLFYIPLLTILSRLIIYLFIPYTYEDAYITFRYAENLAQGNGLVYNPEEPVYGTTTPLFAIILAALYYIGIPCAVSSLIINLIAEGVTSLIVYIFLKNYSNDFIAVIVSLLFVFSPSNISWAIQGMETAFFGGTIALAFYMLYKEKYSLALLVAFFCGMIRIDGLSVTLIISLLIFFTLRLRILKILIIPFLLLIGWNVFLYFYFGSFIPNSMIAKLILYSGHQTSPFPNLYLVLSKFFQTGYYSSSIISVLFILGVILVFKEKLRLYPIIVWFFVYYMALILSRTAIHGWYLIPPLFAYITITGIGIIFIYRILHQKLRLSKRLLNISLSILMLLFSGFTLYLKVTQIKVEHLYEQSVRIPVGEYLRNNTDRNATVFLEPIGVIGYFSQRYIYDDAALISPIFLEFNKLPYNEVSRYKKIQFVRPDYLVLRDIYLEDFYANTPLIEEYTLFKKFESPVKLEHPLFSDMTIFKIKDI